MNESSNFICWTYFMTQEAVGLGAHTQTPSQLRAVMSHTEIDRKGKLLTEVCKKVTLLYCFDFPLFWYFQDSSSQFVYT